MNYYMFRAWNNFDIIIIIAVIIVRLKKEQAWALTTWCGSTQYSKLWQ